MTEGVGGEQEIDSTGNRHKKLSSLSISRILALKVQNQTYNHTNILIFNLLYPESHLIDYHKPDKGFAVASRSNMHAHRHTARFCGSLV